MNYDAGTKKVSADKRKGKIVVYHVNNNSFQIQIIYRIQKMKNTLNGYVKQIQIQSL